MNRLAKITGPWAPVFTRRIDQNCETTALTVGVKEVQG